MDSQNFLHVLDGHIYVGPEFEGSGALEEHHSETVHVLAADFLCDAQELCLCGSIDCVCHDQVGTQIGFVGEPCHAFES